MACLLFIVTFCVSLITGSNTAFAETKTLEPQRDTYVDQESPNSSYGSIGLATVGYQPATSSGKVMLLYFDTSSIPNGSVINSAKLTVRLGGCIGNTPSQGNISLGAYVTNGSANWSETSTYQQLSTSGSSLEILYSKVISCTPGSYVEFDAKELVNYWISGTVKNEGILLNPVSSTYWTRVFYTREAAASSRPKLEVDYTIPYEEVTSPDGGPISEASDAPSSSTNSSASELISQPIAPDPTLNPPTELKAEQKGTDKQIVLKWSLSNSENVNNYRIYRLEEGKKETGQKIGEVAGTESTFTDSDVSEGKSYTYYLRSVRNNLESINTEPVSIEVKGATTENNASRTKAVTKKYTSYLYALGAVLLIACIALAVLAKRHHKLHHKHKELKKSIEAPKKKDTTTTS